MRSRRKRRPRCVRTSLRAPTKITCREKLIMRKNKTVAALAASSMVLGVAAAQAAGGDEDTLAEVTVTAQFREQNLQQTPIAITAITSEILESRSQTNLADVANQAPNVTLRPLGGSFGPAMGASIRG